MNQKKHKRRRFLYYYFSIPCNPVKQHLFDAYQPPFRGESGCKGTTIFRTAKTFQGKIKQNNENSSKIDLCQTKTTETQGVHLIIYNSVERRV